MDCQTRRATGTRRRGLPVYCLLLPAGWLVLTAGCVLSPDLSSIKDTPPVAATDKADERPQRLPHASTCVAFGDFRLKAAADSGRSPAEQELLRDQARKAYLQALKIDLACMEAYRGLGQLYQERGDYDRAQATYRNGLEHLPRNAPLRFELGMCQARQKNWPSALENLKAALDLDPENLGYAKTLGFCLARTGRYDESLACFKKAVGEAQAHYNLARVLHYAHDDARSREHAALALQLKPDLLSARQLLTELDNPSAAPAHESMAGVGFERLDGSTVKPAVARAGGGTP